MPKFLYSAGERSHRHHRRLVQHDHHVHLRRASPSTANSSGNLCADLNGMGGARRSTRDGEHAIAPIFAPWPTSASRNHRRRGSDAEVRAEQVMRDAQGFGKFRGGMGYQQIATFKDTGMWGFMAACVGSKFPSAHGHLRWLRPGDVSAVQDQGRRHLQGDARPARTAALHHRRDHERAARSRTRPTPPTTWGCNSNSPIAVSST